MKNNSKKIFASFLSLMLVFSMLITNSTARALGELSPFGNYTTTHVKDSNLISSVSNPSNGKISFVLTIPSGCTAEYAVELIPNDRTGSIDTVSGSYRNTSSSTIKKTVTASVNYYCTRYTISASYETGTPQNRYIHEDEEAAKSVFHGTKQSSTFIWTKEEIRRYNQGQAIAKVISMGAIEVLSFKIAPLFNSEAAQEGCRIVCNALNVLVGIGGPQTTDIRFNPSEGCGYRIEYQAYNDGYKSTLVVLNKNGAVEERVPLPYVPGGAISRIF